jgi:hypothetical protein
MSPNISPMLFNAPIIPQCLLNIPPSPSIITNVRFYLFFMIKILMKANKEQFIYAKNLIVFYIIWND